jgi:hypothetical protein
MVRKKATIAIPAQLNHPEEINGGEREKMLQEDQDTRHHKKQEETKKS